MRVLKPLALLILVAASAEVMSAPPITSFEYDANGNRKKTVDGLNHVTTYNYDHLDRLKTMVDANNQTTRYSYDVLNQVTAIQDPKGLTTSYAIDGLGNRTTLTSPDTGVTQNTYDDAGNLKTRTDAKGQVTSYGYDELNRLIDVLNHDNTQVTYAYDDASTNGLGRLRSITDNIGTIYYAYDLQGRVTNVVSRIAEVDYSTVYEYDDLGHLTGVIYPSGRMLAFSYDDLGRVNEIATDKEGVIERIVTNVKYQPFGSMKSLEYGNSTTYERQYDTDGRIVSYTLGEELVQLGYDAASRINTIARPDITHTHNYDNLNRLVGYSNSNPAGTNLGFTYDENGNRTSKSVGGVSEIYNYAANSNKLSSNGNGVYTHDANGSLSSDSINQYDYDARGRLVEVNAGDQVYTYEVNSLGQRVKKTVNGVGIIYHYDLLGHLIAESQVDGTVSVEYVYLNNMPIAVFK